MGPNFSLIFYRYFDTGGFVGDVYENARQVEVIVGSFKTSKAKGKTANLVICKYSYHKIEYFFLSMAITCSALSLVCTWMGDCLGTRQAKILRPKNLAS